MACAPRALRRPGRSGPRQREPACQPIGGRADPGRGATPPPMVLAADPVPRASAAAPSWRVRALAVAMAALVVYANGEPQWSRQR